MEEGSFLLLQAQKENSENGWRKAIAIAKL